MDVAGRSHWGWGRTDAAVDAAERSALAARLVPILGAVGTPRPAVDVGAVPVPRSRAIVPSGLADLVSTAPDDRLLHSHGQSFRDVVRAYDGVYERVTDAVARPRDPAEVLAVLEWCSGARYACVPFGGGTSVVGGINPPEGHDVVVTLDLEHLAGLIDVDRTSRLARLGAGTLGPRVEQELRPHGLTLRHYPQSWEFSTLGGWLATRAGGHFATGPTHIDDLTSSIGAVTARGEWRALRVPASGAGPDPNRILLGSEGTLGVITDAWLRVTARPVHRGSATVAFPDVFAGLAAVRDVLQSGLRPANCRLLDPVEAIISQAGDGSRALLVLAFESARHPVGTQLAQAIEHGRDHLGEVTDGPNEIIGDRTATATGGAGEWRRTFLRAPYLRDAIIGLGAIVETFETAVTWDRVDAFVADVGRRVGEAVQRVAGAGIVSVRFTHAYPDGIAPYVTVIAAGTSDRVAAWDEIKSAAGEAIVAAGGTITHHHAVGRDHRPWYDRERPEPFAMALGAVKQVLDPAGVLNPGVLLPG